MNLRRLREVPFLLAAAAASGFAQPVVTDVFPPKEYAARRAGVFAKIGDAVAIVQGTTERPGEQPLRQSNQFHYVCGVVEPRAILVLDGRTKKTTLFLNPRNDRFVTSMYGPGLEPGAEAARATGVEAVLARADFAAVVDAVGREGRVIYTPFRPEVLESASAEGPVALARLNRSDPWDGRGTREDAFRAKLHEAAVRSEIRDLDPIIDEMRAHKSPREIAVIREATRIAGLGIVEAMRDSRPGMFEYELQADAEFVFKKYGAYGASYFALVATGENTYYSHYHKGTAKLKKGDLVQFDYAPDYRNYQSDVTRVFPAHGKFTAWQREYYEIYLQLYRALMTSIRVHATAQEIIHDAVVKMDAIAGSYKFTDNRIRLAAQKFVDGYRNSKATGLGHGVGMEVHDVRNTTATLEPGYIFTIEPEMRIEEMHLGMRLEDMILMTETGYENLSAFVPIEIADIEKLMARGHGLSWAHEKLAPRRVP
jgi:Xaa-Pro aminopeptidase